MPALSLMLPFLLLVPAHAGDILVQTAVSTEIALGHTPLVSTWGEATLRIRDVDPGLAGLRVVRGDRTDVIDVIVPDDGAAVLVVTASAVSTQPATEPEVGPVVEVRAARGQRFAVVVDGTRVGIIGSHHPVRLEGIGAGPHSIELRSADLTVVWTRGDLDLQADDALIITGQEGYAPLVTGRPDAFTLQGTTVHAPQANEPAETTVPAPAGG